MCGRSACTLEPEAIQKQAGATQWKGPSYNVAPMTHQPVMYKDKTGKRCIRLMRWGLVPSWNKDSKMPDLSTINARCETLTTNNMWRGVVKRRRCVVLQSGFFEWKTDSHGRKQPYYIHFPDSRLMAFAGLYDVWRNMETGEKLYTYTIVTTDASRDIAFIHDRMPVIFSNDEQIEQWLSRENPPERVLHLLHPYKGEPKLHYYEVPALVNSVKNNFPDCLMPLSEWNKKGGIASFFVASASIPTATVKDERKIEEASHIAEASAGTASSSSEAGESKVEHESAQRDEDMGTESTTKPTKKRRSTDTPPSGDEQRPAKKQKREEDT